jgi:hypothetical protein
MKLTQRSKILIMVSVFIAFIIIISIVYMVFWSGNASNNKAPIKDQSSVNSYTDKGSGETVYNPPNQTPENYGGAQISFLGFTDLINLGLTSDQLNSLESKFNDYSSKQSTPIKEISITTSSIKQSIDQNSGTITLTFIITIDRKSTLNAQVTYNGISNVSLTLFNSTANAAVYSD